MRNMNLLECEIPGETVSGFWNGVTPLWMMIQTVNSWKLTKNTSINTTRVKVAKSQVHTDRVRTVSSWWASKTGTRYLPIFSSGWMMVTNWPKESTTRLWTVGEARSLQEYAKQREIKMIPREWASWRTTISTFCRSPKTIPKSWCFFPRRTEGSTGDKPTLTNNLSSPQSYSCSI